MRRRPAAPTSSPSEAEMLEAGAVPAFSAPPSAGTLTAAGSPAAGQPRRPPRTAGEAPARPASQIGSSCLPVPLLAFSPPRRRPPPSAPGCLPTSPAITASSPRRTWTITCAL